MIKTLFVDDDLNILQGLRRMLRPMRNEWDMSFANSGEQALEILSEGHFDIIVTDMRMPQMDGAQLLTHVKKLNPGIARIVLSGQADKEAILSTASVAHQFLSKPCPPEIIKNTVINAVKLKKWVGDDNMIKLVSGIDALPSVPSVYKELVEEVSSMENSLTRIGKIFTKDLALSAKVLQLAHSSFFGPALHVESISKTAQYLGSELLRTLALSDFVFKPWEGETGRDTIAEIAVHAQMTGLLAQTIARDMTEDSVIIEESFQSGILHDIGSLILLTYFTDQYLAACEKAAEQGRALYEVEIEEFGCSHYQLGGSLLALWGLPESIVEAAACHHNLSECQLPADGFSAVMAVHLANAVLDHCQDGNELRVDALLGDQNRIMQNMDQWLKVAKEQIEDVSA